MLIAGLIGLLLVARLVYLEVRVRVMGDDLARLIRSNRRLADSAEKVIATVDNLAPLGNVDVLDAPNVARLPVRKR